MAELNSVWATLERLYVYGRLPHALAFTGGEASGSLELAWRLAQRILCERENAPCGECGNCRRVESRQSESVFFAEPDKGVIKLESAHEILAFLSLQRIGKARVVIVGEAQKLNPQAANALLKVIEEPPPETFFILVTTEFSQLLPTLRSRCQVIRLAADRLATQPEDSELKGIVLDYLQQSFLAQREGVTRMLEHTKDRGAAQMAIQVLQEILRDWSTLEAGVPLHRDLTEAIRVLPPVADELKMELWRGAFQMELDLAAHVDKALIFENFYLRAKNCVAAQ